MDELASMDLRRRRRTGAIAAMTTQLTVVRIRVTLDCPECASPIPVNGVVPTVLCHGCHTVVELEGELGWDKITTYAKGEGRLVSGSFRIAGEIRALDYLLMFRQRTGRPQRLYRSHQGILLEVDERPPKCLECGHGLDAATLLKEAYKEQEPKAFCGQCGTPVPLRRPEQEHQWIHPTIAAIVNETALQGDLTEPQAGAPVLFACLGCGASLEIDGTAPRISTCKYCDATSYLPDALWLRLHPAQRKRAFHLLLTVSAEALEQARRATD